tara:strand:+ start:100 stop:768 length:669 start_codon:yes stop_codon:yes gene_type:complete
MVKVALLFSAVAVVAARRPRSAKDKAEQKVTETHRDFIKNQGGNAHRFHNKGIGQCTGDCDSNSNCAKGLKCMVWTDAVKVSLCKGHVSRRNKRFQYCGNPHAKTMTADSKTIVSHGKEVVTAIQKFGQCRGHCKSDGDCQTGLKCHQRIGSEVPASTGCVGNTATDENHNYCFSPVAITDPRRCSEWTCTEWCTLFDAEAEKNGVYAKNGCEDEGSSLCEC